MRCRRDGASGESAFEPLFAIDERGERGEKVARVMRTRAGFWVILDGEATLSGQREPLDDAVVEIDMGHARSGHRGIRDRVTVVLGGHLDDAGRDAANRMVRAVVTEGELVGLAAEGGCEDLVPKADAEDRHCSDELANGRAKVAERGRISGAVREEDAVRVAFEHLLCWRPGGNDLDGRDLRELGEDHRFDPEVVGDDSARSAASEVGSGRRDLVNEIDPGRPRFACGEVGELGDASGSERAWHRALFAYVSCQAASVDTRESADPMRDEERFEVSLCAPR